jgi:hypothetical protein
MRIAGPEVARSPGHRFYETLNELLKDAEFDRRVEALCAPYFEADDEPRRRSIAPCVYFRMLFVGYFEGSTRPRGASSPHGARHGELHDGSPIGNPAGPLCQGHRQVPRAWLITRRISPRSSCSSCAVTMFGTRSQWTARATGSAHHKDGRALGPHGFPVPADIASG